MSNVLSIVPAMTETLARQDCIEMFESLLQAAINGEIIHAAVATIHPDGRAFTFVSDAENYVPMLGAIQALSATVLEEVRS